MERTQPHHIQEPVPGKEPLAKRVWYGVSKFAESQSPEAWGGRIIKIIDTKIIPKLSIEQQFWAREHQEEIETAANAVGAGITTAEIVGAVALGAKVIDVAKYRLDLARARRNIQWVKPYPDLPAMPIMPAASGAYELSPDTIGRIDAMYFEDNRQTTNVLRSVRKKWKDINSTIGSHHWLTEQLNGTIATLFDMTEEPDMKMFVQGLLPQNDTDQLPEAFERLFMAAHRQAAERFHWPFVMPHDARAVMTFWNRRFDRLGLTELRERVHRIQRAPSRLGDPLIAEMVKHIEVSPLPFARYIDDDWFFTDAVKSRTYVKDPSFLWLKLRKLTNTVRELRGPIVDHHLISMEQLQRDELTDVARRNRILKDAIAFLPEATWKNPNIPAKLEYALRVLHVDKTEDIETLGILLDNVWGLRKDSDVQDIIRGLDDARRRGDATDLRRYATILLERAYGNKPQFQEFMQMGDSYYTRHDRLRDIAQLWVTRLRGVGIEDLIAVKRRPPTLIQRVRNALFAR